jgi:hypothetical protein
MALGLALAGAASAQAASSKSTGVALTVDSYYNVSASGSANLSIPSLSWEDLSFNFIGAGAPDYGSITLITNTPWEIRCKLNANMPTSPGDGYMLKVDDNRGQFDNAGWSAPLSTTDVVLDFANDGAVTNGRTYNLDWRIEGLTASDGKDAVARVATFTVFAAGIV